MFPLSDFIGSDAAGRRELNKTRTRRRLNSEAMRLFAERGYEATSVEDIADAAEVSVRTLFRYFESKDEILFARDYDLSSFLAGVAGQPTEVPPLTAIRIAYAQQRPLTQAEIDLVLQYRRAGEASPALQGRLVALQRRFRQQLAQVLARRAGRRQPNKADLIAARVAQGLLDLAFDQWADKDGRGRLAGIVDATFATFDELVGTRTEDEGVA
jgi:AcrR family transcriptional regulator